MGITYEPASLEPTGIDPSDVAALAAEADAARDAVTAAPFVADLENDFEPPGRAGADRVVVLGIGGSALGARCVHATCAGDGDVLPLHVVDNIDPDAVEAALALGDPNRTLWVPVSKSGGTTETLAQLAVVRGRCPEAPVHVVTGPRGPLRELAERDGHPVATVPEPVGGRFSVFTPAATVPLALAGHDVGALLAGAREAAAHCREEASVAARLAALLVAASRAGRNVVTTWSYAERLEVAGEWFRQLWAESLGKQREDGERVGQTPLHCVGSTDQHSIQQLMVEGPRDKAALVLAGPPTASTAAPDDAPGAGAGHALADILDAMRRATTAEMVRAGCPAATIKLDAWEESDIARVLMVLMAATTLAGRLLGVDPYGQPGVEAAKAATKGLLSEPDGATSREIAELLGEGAGQRC